VVEASGGLVLRPGPEVLLVHRPRYDDWTFPKGKNDLSENAEAAALREVLEETGYRCRIMETLPETRYLLATGEEKRVAWFAMRLISGEFVANDEVDQIAWQAPEQAIRQLTYQRDQDLLEAVDLGRLLTTGTLYLVRHAAAGSRFNWQGDDAERPLSGKGLRQADQIAAYLSRRGVDRITTSPYLRCRQTIEPLAGLLGLPVEVVPELAEAGAYAAAFRFAGTLVGSEAVICSHGDVIPALLDRMLRQGMELESAFECRKGSIWEVAVTNGNFSRARYHPAPEV